MCTFVLADTFAKGGGHTPSRPFNEPKRKGRGQEVTQRRCIRPGNAQDRSLGRAGSHFVHDLHHAFRKKYVLAITRAGDLVAPPSAVVSGKNKRTKGGEGCYLVSFTACITGRKSHRSTCTHTQA